ncbi:MAG: TolC family outer membrane protein [Gammaproteobacteria bacterium]|nr:TolC family outer membrane protein [Gammaproteobacteria bacterium]
MAGFFIYNVSAHGLGLSDYIADTLSAHPSVQEQVHIFRQVVRDQDIAASGWQPSVDLQASTGKYESESPFTGPDRVEYNSTRTELSVTQNLFNGFDTEYQLEQTHARIRSALYEIYDTADNIALEAIQAFLEVLKQQRLYELASENVTSHENILSQIRERSNSGVGRRSQLQQTEGRVARAHASLIAQQNNLQDAMTQMHQVLGRYIKPANLSEPKLPPHPGMEIDDLIDMALANHPAIRVASYNIQSAQSDYQRSKRNNYPKLDLKLAKEVGDDLNGLEGDTDNLSLVLNMSYNFYHGGADQAERKKKISAVHEQQQFAARVRRQVINTLRLAWVADQSLNRQLKFLSTHIVKSRETVASYREEFFIGQRDLIDLLDAENELNTAQNQYTQAYFEALSARYRIYEGVGTLFDVLNLQTMVGEEDLKISRVQAQAIDELPLKTDRDLDKEQDVTDHCDNTLKNDPVNNFGCMSQTLINFGYQQVNSIPRLGDDQFELDKNSVMVITRAMLLKNDTDDDGDALSLVDFTQPDNGKLAMDASKNLIYRSTEGFAGIDIFTYTVSDGHGAVAKARVKMVIPPTSEISLSKTHYVNFVFNKAELTEESRKKVQLIVDKVKQQGDIKVRIFAYTDNIGSDSYNLSLSKRRAQAIRELLISKGLEGTDIKAYGMGERDPIADNTTTEGQAINRRGEFRFILNTKNKELQSDLLPSEK